MINSKYFQGQIGMKLLQILMIATCPILGLCLYLEHKGAKDKFCIVLLSILLTICLIALIVSTVILLIIRWKDRAFLRSEWLFFDIGSTLIDEEKVYQNLFENLSAKVGMPVEEIQNKVIDANKSNQNGFNYVVASLGVQKPTWQNHLEMLYPDTITSLQKLSQRYKLGIIANQSLGLQSRLEQFGILQYFTVIVSSADVGVAKPDKAIFEIALKKCGCKANRTTMVGDRLDNDIQPANSVGMNTVWVKQGYGKYWTVRNKNQLANAVVDDLSQLTQLFCNRR